MKIAALALLSFAASASAFSAPASLPLRAATRANAATSVRMQQVDLLERGVVVDHVVVAAVETLKVLTAVSKSGLLSKIEKAGVLSQLEKQIALALAEAGLIYAVPDDSTGAIAAQVITGLVAVAAAVPLVVTGKHHTLAQYCTFCSTVPLLSTALQFAVGCLGWAVPRLDETLMQNARLAGERLHPGGGQAPPVLSSVRMQTLAAQISHQIRQTQCRDLKELAWRAGQLLLCEKCRGL
eukprot:2662122-Rhodomonas_salina.2